MVGNRIMGATKRDCLRVTSLIPSACRRQQRLFWMLDVRWVTLLARFMSATRA